MADRRRAEPLTVIRHQQVGNVAYRAFGKSGGLLMLQRGTSEQSLSILAEDCKEQLATLPLEPPQLVFSFDQAMNVGLEAFYSHEWGDAMLLPN
jgi:hypothetical protein